MYFNPFNATFRFLVDSIRVDNFRGKLRARIAEFEPLMSLDFHYTHKGLLASMLLVLVALAFAGSFFSNVPVAVTGTDALSEHATPSFAHAMHEVASGNVSSSHHCDVASEAACLGNTATEAECPPSFDCSIVALTGESYAPKVVYGESRVSLGSPMYASITTLPAYMPPIDVYI